MFSFVKGSGIEVFVRSSILGLFSLTVHNRCFVGIGYTDMDGTPRHICRVYIWPNTQTEQVSDELNRMCDYDTLVGGFNSRYGRWDCNGYMSQIG